MPFGPYILDFAIVSARLAIELDGDTHYLGAAPEADAGRDAYVRRQGWQTLRFTNTDVMSNIDGVLTVIASAAAGNPHPGPLPEGERAGEKAVSPGERVG